ncbi:hypothetical protein L6452_40127 [Arctium lappa]|uniref:Uncharacterized protein n=1 Tax=Arctium lappa TaxID=4217 RepID=A0ACB8XLA6_ARCLA|nr:hypothetical protein L6452_40127 [Arctium lappa]
MRLGRDALVLTQTTNYRSIAFLSQSLNEDNDVPLDYSLRSYLEVIFLDPWMKIYVQGSLVKSRPLARFLQKTTTENGFVLGKPVQLILGHSQLDLEQGNCGFFLYWHGRLIEVALAETDNCQFYILPPHPDGEFSRAVVMLDISIDMIYSRIAGKENPMLAVVDDGNGMSYEEIMKMVSFGRKQIDTNDSNYIARYGVGFKGFSVFTLLPPIARTPPPLVVLLSLLLRCSIVTPPLILRCSIVTPPLILRCSIVAPPIAGFLNSC